MALYVAPANLHLLSVIGAGPGRGLDVGTGQGGALLTATARGWSPIGLDLAAEQPRAARQGHAAVVHADAAISNFGLIFAPDPS